VHTVLASMYLERSRFDEALREFDEDIRIDPTRAAFHRLKGLIYQSLGRSTEAADAFHAAWMADSVDPQNAYQLLVHPSARTTAAQRAQTREVLATLERELVRGTRARAESPFLSLRPINDDADGALAFAPAAYSRALSRLLTGEINVGMTALRDAIAKDPLVADSALRLEPMTRGIAALRRGQIAEAIESIKAASALAPDSSDVRRILATAERINGDVAACLQHLRDAVRLNPKNERAWLALARTLDDTGAWAEAGDVLRKAVSELPDAGELRWQLSLMSATRQRTDNADLELIAAADRLVLLAGTGELYDRIGRMAQAHLEYDRAITLLEQRVVLAPNNALAHQALGRAYVDQGRENEGYAELVIALWLQPDSATALGSIGRLHLSGGRYPQAIEALTRAVTLAPADAQSVHALGDALVRAGKLNEGEPWLKESARLQANAVETQRRSRTAAMLSLQAEIDMSQGRYDQAIETWQQARELESRNAATHLRLADAFVAAKKLDQAARELEIAISLKAGADAHRRLASVYADLGRTDDSARERHIYTEERLQELRGQ